MGAAEHQHVRCVRRTFGPVRRRHAIRHALTRPLTLSVVLALLGGLAAYFALAGAGATTKGIAVVQMARPVLAGQRLATADLELRSVPVSAASPDAARTIEEVVGRYATMPMLKGETLLKQKTSDRVPGSNLASLIPPGCVAVSVAVSDVVSTGRFIAPGDRVDVLGVITRDAADRAEIVLRDVMVLAVASELIGGDAPAPVERSNGRANPRSFDATVTVALGVEDAQRLVQVDEIGKLRLALRAHGEDAGALAPCPSKP